MKAKKAPKKIVKKIAKKALKKVKILKVVKILLKHKKTVIPLKIVVAIDPTSKPGWINPDL